ncbi:MAG: hypothetical protein HY515_03930 [Candidatus Aenigmarchaeota archaeon]|nr:hypothetical protein [Candidatus Aenigmarchaeota archaeon]
MVTLTFGRYLDRAEHHREFRPWTFIADLFTGVARRDEAHTYEPAILDAWTKGLKTIELKDTNTDKYADLETGGRPRKLSTVSVQDLPERIEKMMAWNNGPSSYLGHFGMQKLEYRDGTVRITLNFNYDDL